MAFFKNNFTSDQQKYLLGVACKVVALTCFCLLSLVFEKLKNHNIGSVEQFGIVCLIGTCILLPFVVFLYPKELKQAKLKFYPIRALFSIFGMITWIEAVKHFGSNQAILVNYLTPIITILLASITRNEKLRMIAIAFGVICYGIIFITLKTHIEVANYGFVAALASSCCWAFYEVICKKQTLTEHFLIQVFYTFAFAAVFLLPFSFSSLFQLSANDLMIFSIISILRITNVILLFLAIKLATLNWLTPVSYLKLPFMAFWGFVLYSTVPEVAQLIAAALLITINALMIAIRRRAVKY